MFFDFWERVDKLHAIYERACELVEFITDFDYEDLYECAENHKMNQLHDRLFLMAEEIDVEIFCSHD